MRWEAIRWDCVGINMGCFVCYVKLSKDERLIILMKMISKHDITLYLLCLLIVGEPWELTWSEYQILQCCWVMIVLRASYNDLQFNKDLCFFRFVYILNTDVNKPENVNKPDEIVAIEESYFLEILAYQKGRGASKINTALKCHHFIRFVYILNTDVNKYPNWKCNQTWRNGDRC